MRDKTIASALADDQPDGIYWYEADNNMFAIACAHCAHLAMYDTEDAEFTVRQLASHLWYGHKLRRVWMDRFDVSAAAAVQMVMPLALDAAQRAQSRSLRAVR